MDHLPAGRLLSLFEQQQTDQPPALKLLHMVGTAAQLAGRFEDAGGQAEEDDAGTSLRKLQLNSSHL